MTKVSAYPASDRRTIISALTFLVVAGVLIGFFSRSATALPQVAVKSGLKLNTVSRLKPGVYHLAEADGGIVQISGSGFVVECAGAKIFGPGKGEGIGIHITDARNVTIRNADVSGCLWGIVIERSVGVKLVNCRTSLNHDMKPGTTIDESGREPEDQWGGGILLRDCRDCLARRCVSQYQWDGIDVVRSQDCVIEDGDYSYNGNWGVHLWDSSSNIFRRNRAIWCTTGAGKLYQGLTGWQRSPIKMDVRKGVLRAASKEAPEPAALKTALLFPRCARKK